MGKLSTKKLLMGIFAFAFVSCAATGASLYNASIDASAATGSDIFTETKCQISNDGERMLIVTGIKDVDLIYELGYEINGAEYEAQEGDTAETDTYYESLTLGSVTKTAGEFIEGAEGLLVWEINYDSAVAYSLSAYAYVGELNDNGQLIVPDQKSKTYATTKTNFNVFEVTYLDVDGSELSKATVNWGATAEKKTIETQANDIGVWVDETGKEFDFTQVVTKNLTLQAKIYDMTVEAVAGATISVTTDQTYTFGQEYAMKLTPSSWTTTFRLEDEGLATAFAYKFDVLLPNYGGLELAIYYCEASNWDQRVLLHTFTSGNEKATLTLTKAQYQSLLADTADLEYCVKEYQGSVGSGLPLYVSKVSTFVEKSMITMVSGNINYDTTFVYGEETYSTKLTGTGWTIDFKLSGDTVDTTACDFVVFQVYTTDFNCNCDDKGHAGEQALRDLPTTSYSSGTLALADSTWTEVTLKAADYNSLIENGTRLRIHNSCTAANRNVWFSQPQAVKASSQFNVEAKTVSLAKAYEGKPVSGYSTTGWSLDLLPTVATEQTTGNMVFYIRTDNYAKGNDHENAVKIDNKWYSNAIVVGEWMKVTIPVDVWNKCVAGTTKIRINDSNSVMNVIYYITEAVWEAA